MSLEAVIGPEINLLGETPDHCHQLVMPQPILRSTELEKLRQVDHSVFEARTIDTTWPVSQGAQGMEARIEEIRDEASELVSRGVNILILSDRNLGVERAAIPNLLSVGAVHHRLVREGSRLRTGLVVETGQAKEIHHLACLIGYGASAVNPYVMFESLYALHRDGRLPEGMPPDEAVARTIKAIGKGLLKILSKMGISTIRSYTGAQIFEAVGLEAGAGRPLLHRHAVARGRRWAQRARVGGARPPRARLSRRQLRAAAGGRRLRLAPRRRVPRLEPGDDRHAPAGRPRGRRPRRVRALRHLRERGGRAEVLAARAARVQRGTRADPARRGRAGRRDREALQVGRHVAGRALTRGARDARRRDEPARREVEHRRGRGGPGPLRRRAPLIDQAGGLRALRRDRELPRERRRAPDQGRAGREARRGRAAARPQGRPLHRAPASLDAGRGADLAASAPRHLLDRGPQAAHLRPALREPARPCVGEARVRGRRGHRRRRRGQGQRRPRGDRRPRRRHRARRRRPRSRTPASPGRSGSPRPSRRCSETTCARGSSWRPTARCAPAATW